MEEQILPLIKYIEEDKSEFPQASTKIDPKTEHPYIDKDGDFLIGNSGGFLMNIDFKFVNTDIFSEVARTYDENKKNQELVDWVESLDIPPSENRNKYYYYPKLSNTIDYVEFWRREENRRSAGMTAKCKLLDTGKIVKLRITGDHYNYLNYGRIMRTPSEEEREELNRQGRYKVKKIQGFPRFWDGDYWNFKIDEFITNNNFHLCKSKARRKGYSFKRGSQGANTINIYPYTTIVLAAYDISYLTDPSATSDMLKTNLDWYEDNTHWKRFYISESLDKLELGYKKSGGGNKKYGWRSKALSVTIAKNASAAIGKDAIEIDLEESGKCPNLQDFLNVTLSSTEAGAGQVGTIRLYGTGGTKEADWEPFSEAFYNPSANSMMPLENVWDKSARETICGFFHPQIWNLEPFMDEHGNSLIREAYEYDKKDKATKRLSLGAKDLAIYIGQRANSPEEAFKNTQDNLFASAVLDDHIKQVRYSPERKYYKDGMFTQGEDGYIRFVSNRELELRDITTHPYIEDVPFKKDHDLYGCVREFHPPYTDNGIVPSNLYYISYDPVGKDKESGLITSKNSLNSFYVISYPNNISNCPGDRIMAAYCGRPEKMEDANKILLLAAKRYNAKILCEVNRGQTVQDFRRWRELNWLYRDPTSAINEKLKESQIAYGIEIGDKGKLEDGLIYLKDWLYEVVSRYEDGREKLVLHEIDDLPTLLELQKFTRKGNFDRISSLVVAMFQRAVYRIKKNKPKVNKGKSFYDKLDSILTIGMKR